MTLSERNLAILLLLLYGLRASEVCKLNMEDYIDRTRLRIRKAKSDSKRTIPLNQEAREVLDQYLEWCEAQGQE
ncbi:tyrosine-type recombinase/integrase [Leptolyngbya sp. AN03gr2]|uniref:tyrosine-type recombinase/integrase n=1 Tax=Leptolyngbya sp. AN03gr2 TaxID=3423364 RepID=UPI003D3127C5